MGKQSHPDNLKASFGRELANHLYAILECDAQSGGGFKSMGKKSKEEVWQHYVIRW
jgi:hypothetical protein